MVKLLKKMKLIKYYGISIYSQNEFYNFRKYGKPKIVQAFERSFVSIDSTIKIDNGVALSE